MTIATAAIVAGPFSGNGVAATFSFAFKVFQDSDVLVEHTDVAGTDRTAVLNTDYLVTRNADQDANPGGFITWRITGITTPLPVDEKVTISSKVPETQTTALPTGGPYSAKVLEAMIDKVTILVKQFGRNVVRALRQPLTDAVTMNELPSASQRRGRYLYFEDSAAAHPTAVANLSAAVAVSAYMETVLDAVDDVEARAALGVSGTTPSLYMEGVIDAADSEEARAALEILGTAAPSDPGPAGVNGTATDAAPMDHVHRYQIEHITVAASDESTNITTGTNKIKFRMPYAFTLTDVRASLSTAQTAGATLLTVDVNENGTTILSTKLTFDNNETTTTTAATPRVISDAALADDAEISIDVDAIGTAGARGLKVTLIGRRAS